jgi:hypothetical protein
MKYTPCLNNSCFFTKQHKDRCEVHHVFYGSGNRKLSEKYGMKVYLSYDYHRGSKNGVHHNKENDLKVKRYAQEQFEKQYSHEEFMRVFKRNYL